jgi:hypothetical protein
VSSPTREPKMMTMAGTTPQSSSASCHAS